MLGFIWGLWRICWDASLYVRVLVPFVFGYMYACAEDAFGLVKLERCIWSVFVLTQRTCALTM